MKGVLVILDGMADLPCSQLKEKTPLEAAETPNMNFFAARGELGYMYPVKPAFVPESDQAIISIFGNDLLSSTRGELEAIGADVKLMRGDLALRANFATIDNIKDRNIIDRRVGRTLTTQEALVLAKDINNKIKIPCKFLFKPTVQHRAVLVLRGGFSDNVSGNDLVYSQGKAHFIEKAGYSKPMDDDDNSQYTANVLNEFLEKTHEILENHPVNEARRKRGLLPANFLLVRDAGIDSPKLKRYNKWISVTYMPLETGFTKQSGMRNFSFEYPKMRDLDVYRNLNEALTEACRFAEKVIWKNRKKADYAYVHFKETDIPGHDNKPMEKKEMIELIDRTFFRFLKDFAPQNKISVVVTADHSTPCKLKAHSADPVPVLFYNHSIPLPHEKKFGESEARKGKLGRILGSELLEKTGFGK